MKQAVLLIFLSAASFLYSAGNDLKANDFTGCPASFFTNLESSSFGDAVFSAAYSRALRNGPEGWRPDQSVNPNTLWQILNAPYGDNNRVVLYAEYQAVSGSISDNVRFTQNLSSRIRTYFAVVGDHEIDLIYSAGMLEIVERADAIMRDVSRSTRDPRYLDCYMQFLLDAGINIFEIRVERAAFVNHVFLSGFARLFYTFADDMYAQPTSVPFRRGERTVLCRTLAGAEMYADLIQLIDIGYIDRDACIENIRSFANPYVLGQM